MSHKLQPGLSGYCIVRRAISGDYTPILAAKSMLPVCDEVLLVDCHSDDGTLEMLCDFAAMEPKVRVVRWPWPKLPTFDEWKSDLPRPANNNVFWPALINELRPLLRYDMQLHLDGDEVLMPCSYEEVRKAVSEKSCRWLRRINWWKDIRNQVPEGHVCGTNVARLGPTALWMPSDEQCPDGEPEMRKRATFHPDLQIGHLGFLRHPAGFYSKSKSLQVAICGTYDPRLVQAEAENKDWWELSTFNAPLQSWDGEIPELIKPWLLERGRIPEQSRIIHLAAYVGLPDGATARRMGTARDSWQREYDEQKGHWNASVLTFVRNSLELGDANPVPYVRDMIAQGIGLAANDKDILFLTNADVGFAPHITARLRMTVAKYGAVYMRRAEFAEITALPTLEQMREIEPFVGGDGFAFTVGWWKTHGDIFPDMLLGRYGWDSAMKNLIRRAGGVEMRGELFHESHVGQWVEKPDAIWENPANAHNRDLLLAWCETYGGSPEDHLFTTEELHYK